MTLCCKWDEKQVREKLSLLIFSIFARFFKFITTMKRIIVLIVMFFFAGALFTACDTQKKCAAYGHYACYEVQNQDAVAE